MRLWLSVLAVTVASWLMKASAPLPYTLPAMTPSYSAYSIEWSPVGIASLLTVGSSDGPRGTAHDFSTPSTSSRTS